MSDDATNRLIDELFERIKQAEKQTGERDKDAESHINKHLVQQPAAPYYMAQTIIMQEAALKRLNARVEELEKALAEKPSSGGFLSGLFGSGDSQKNNQSSSSSGWGSSAQQNNQNANQRQGYGQASGWGQQAQPNAGYAPSGGRSFLGGALQTAAGVAGGMVVGNMLMNMFGHHNPTEIVDVIQDPTAGQGMDNSNFDPNGFNQDSFGNAGFDQGNGFDQGSGFGNAGFDQGSGVDQGSGFGNAGFDQGSGFGQGGGFADTNFDQGNGFDQGGFGGGFDGGGFDDFGGGGFDDI